jgi:hypothetical protein
MIILAILGAGCLYILYKIKRHADLYKDIPGISHLEFLKDASDLPRRTSLYKGTKLVRIDTPVESMVLATHPDSAKVI